jgi:hypothetical protein
MDTPLEPRVETRVDFPRIVANVILIPLGFLFAWAAAPRIDVIGRLTESMLSVATFTFLIWAVVFVAQCAYAFYQAQPAHHLDAPLRRVGWNTALNGLLLGCWGVSFANGYVPLAWVILVAMVVNLAIAEAELGEDAYHDRPLLMVRTPLVLTLGWLSFLLVVQTSTMLTSMIGYVPSHGAAVAWTVTMMILTACYGAFMTVWRRHAGYAFVIAWGLLGVGAYRVGLSPAVGVTAFVFAAMLVVIGAAELAAIARGYDLRRFHFRELHLRGLHLRRARHG